MTSPPLSKMWPLAPLVVATLCLTPACGGSAGAPTDAAPRDAALPDGGNGDSAADTGRDSTIAPDASDATTTTETGVPDAGGDTAGDGGSGLGAPQALVGARSFNVTATITYAPRPAGTHLPPTAQTLRSFEFVARIDPVAELFTMGADGAVSHALTRSSDHTTFAVRAPVSMLVSAPASTLTCGRPTVRLDSFALTTHERGAIGTAQGRLSIIEGDVAWDLEISLTMTAIIDTRAPTLRVIPQPLHPLDGIYFAGSEPLPHNTSASLRPMGVTGDLPAIVPLTPFAPDDARPTLGGFHKPPMTALAAGTSYWLILAPFGDLADNVGTDFPIITTAPVPAMLADGGFEAAGVTEVGGAPVFDSSYLPPITGTRSVLIAPGGPFNGPVNGPLVWNKHFRVRLATPTAPGGAPPKLRFSARPIATVETAQLRDLSIRIANVKGGPIATALLPTGAPGPLVRHAIPAARGGGQVWLAPVVSVESPLPPGPGGELMLDIESSYPTLACGLFPPHFGLIIDDVRIQ